MTAPITIKNAVDAWVDQSTGKTKTKSTKLQLRAATGGLNQRFAFVHHNPVWPDNAIILSATLRVRNVGVIGTSTTITAKSVSGKWDINRLTYANQPAVLSSSAAVTKATAVDADTWDIDVKTLLQNAVNAGKFFGFRLETNNTSAIQLHARESDYGKYRPRLIVAWMEQPDAPDELSPAYGLKVSKQYPIMTYDYNDPMGDFQLLSQQLQIGTSQANVDAGVTTFDSGEVTAVNGAPEFDTSLPTYSAWAGLVDGAANVWWRCRSKDAVSGIWSPWAAAVEMGRVSKGVLAFTALASITEGSQTISWSLTGRTQTAYRLGVAYADTPNEWIYDSGHITSTATSHTIPWGVIKDPSKQYVITLRVWDDQQRASTPGDPVYVEIQSAALNVTYDGTVTDVTSLSVTSDPVLPMATLTFNYSGPADYFQVQRSLDGGATWQYTDEVLVTSAFTGGTAYAIIDSSAPTYEAVTWRVLAVAGGKQSTGAVVNGQIRRRAPFIMRLDGTDAVCLLNPKRSQANQDLQAVQTTLSGNNVLTTQRLGKKSGHVEGLITDESLPGTTAATMIKRFRRLRDDSGITVIVATANATYKAVAYNFQDDIITDSSGVAYTASFDWVEP